MSAGPVAFVGDSHLLPDEATVGQFVQFVESCPGRFERLVLVGDIFDLWIARTRLHEDHQRSALQAIAAARARGLAIDYAVGNRDYGVETLKPSPFDRVATTVLAAPGQQPAWLAEHGDLINTDDRQYARWRAFSRSHLVLGSFLALPPAVALPTSRWLERRMRTTNLAYRRAFPTAHALERARVHFETTGARFLVLGHFHQELRLEARGGDVVVLPDWKRSLRHAEWHPSRDGGNVQMARSL